MGEEELSSSEEDAGGGGEEEVFVVLSSSSSTVVPTGDKRRGSPQLSVGRRPPEQGCQHRGVSEPLHRHGSAASRQPPSLSPETFQNFLSGCWRLSPRLAAASSSQRNNNNKSVSKVKNFVSSVSHRPL